MPRLNWKYSYFFEQGWNAARYKNVADARISMRQDLMDPEVLAAFEQGVHACEAWLTLNLEPSLRARFYDAVKNLAEVMTHLPAALNPGFAISTDVQDVLEKEALSRGADFKQDFDGLDQSFAVQLLSSLRQARHVPGG